jgi:hypothetical protein
MCVCEQGRLAILSKYASHVVQEHLVTFRLFIVDFTKRDDPFFVTKQVSDALACACL